MTDTIGWFLPSLFIGVVVAGAAMVAMTRWIRNRPGEGDDLDAELAESPMTGLQRSAWWGLIGGLAALTAISGVIAWKGVDQVMADDVLRVAVELVFVAALGVYAAMLGLTAAGKGSGSRLDERDHRILARAPAFQTLVVVLTLAVWLIVLGERFGPTGSVPVPMLNLVFGSIILIGFVGHAAGVVVSYWIGDDIGQG